jgi:CheY-like chemotaxis protein
MVRILFVDDDPLTLNTYNKAVSINGYEAILANSASEALSLSVDKKPDLIMLDMRMPDMDGFDLLTHLRADENTTDIPVVMLSADPEMELSRLSKAAGAQAYISKPIRLDKLLDIIHEFTSE